MTTVKLVKYHGCGNDFVVVDVRDLAEIPSEEWPNFARAVCDRHSGIGADGVLVVARPDRKNPVSMVIWNADGSHAEMCGNGIRCVADYAMKRDWARRPKFVVVTDAGPKEIEVVNTDQFKVNMGPPNFDPEKIPTTAKVGSRNIPVVCFNVGGPYINLAANCVSMGNPHAVVFVSEGLPLPIEIWGSRIESSEFFPNRTNVEFVVVDERDPNKVRARVWERGVGETLACGTGACAIAVVGIQLRVMESPVKVELPGGILAIEWDGEGEGTVFMTGPAIRVAEATYHYKGGS